jgi:predicted nucleic acid-binding protein
MASGVRSFVVDATISAAWFLPDEATASTEAALQATATHDVWVPAIWLLEVGNLLLSAQRRKRITAEKRRELAAAAAALRIKVDREPVAIPALDGLAARHALSAYDAAYLELATRRSLPLATLDRALMAAMVKAGVPAARLDGSKGG